MPIKILMLCGEKSKIVVIIVMLKKLKKSQINPPLLNPYLLKKKAAKGFPSSIGKFLS